MDYNVQEILAKRKANIDKLQNYLDAGKTLDEKVVKKTLQNIRRGEQQLIDNGYTNFDAINDDGTFSSKNSSSNEIPTVVETPEVKEVNTSSVSDEANNTSEVNTDSIVHTEVNNHSAAHVEVNDTTSATIQEVKNENNSVLDDSSNAEISEVKDIVSNETSTESSLDAEKPEVTSEIAAETQNYSNEVTSTTTVPETTVSIETTPASQDAPKPKTKKKLDKLKKNKTEKLGVSIKKSNITNIAKLAKDSSRTPNNVVNVMLETIYDEENEMFNVEFSRKEENKNTSYLIDERYARAIDVISKKTNLSKSDIFNILLEEALKDYI